MLLLFWREGGEPPVAGVVYYDSYTGGRNPDYSASFQDRGIVYTATALQPTRTEYVLQDEE